MALITRFVSALVLVLVPSLALAQLDPAIKCEASKLKLTGKFASCRLMEDARALKAGKTADYMKCNDKFLEGWAKVQEKIGGTCPALAVAEEVRESIVECVPSTQYTVAIVITDEVPLGSIRYEVGYSAAPGEFVGSGATVACVSAIPGSLNEYDDDDASRVLTGETSKDSFIAPVELARCTFDITGISSLEASDFTITPIDATTPEGFGIVPLPAMEIQIVGD